MSAERKGRADGSGVNSAALISSDCSICGGPCKDGSCIWDATLRGWTSGWRWWFGKPDGTKEASQTPPAFREVLLVAADRDAAFDPESNTAGGEVDVRLTAPPEAAKLDQQLRDAQSDAAFDTDQPSLLTAIEQMKQAIERLSGSPDDAGGRTVTVNETVLRSWLSVLENEAERKLRKAVAEVWDDA